MDIVYILKEDNNNIDLVYSLRTLYNNVSGYENIWCVGYKPDWVSDTIQYIPTIQSGTKWENSFYNVCSACRAKGISDDFILYNDDFFAINKVNLYTDINHYRNTLDEAIEMYSKQIKTRWIKAHQHTKDLLISLNSSHFLNFALHIPFKVNKEKFLEMANNPIVTSILNRYHILQYRSVYGNLYWNNPTQMKDCKGKKGMDLTDDELENGQWISVFDNTTNNLDKYPIFNRLLSPYKNLISPFEKYSII